LLFRAVIIDQLQASFADEDVGIAFLYCNYKKQTEQTPVNLVSSLLKQLVEKNTFLLDDLESLYTQHLKKPRPTLSEISSALKAAVTRLSKVFIVVDALDECLRDNNIHSSLLGILGTLPQTASLLLTSRPNVRIDEVFPNAQTREILASQEDVQAYLEARVSRKTRLARVIRSDISLGQRIIEKVSNNAKGMCVAWISD
jgi:hypothetical protein